MQQAWFCTSIATLLRSISDAFGERKKRDEETRRKKKEIKKKSPSTKWRTTFI